MSDAANAATETQPKEPSEAALEYAMAQGFSGVRGTEPPAPLKPEDTATNDQNATTDTPSGEEDDGIATESGEGAGAGDAQGVQDQTTTQDDKVEQAKELIAGLSPEQLKAVLGEVPVIRDRLNANEQALRKVQGQYGEIKQAFQVLQKGGSAQPVKIDPAKLKRTATTFDADAATALAEDLQEILSEIPRGSAAEPVDLDNRIDARVQAVQKAVQRSVNEMFLSFEHPDWKDVVGTADFRLWLETKPANERAQIAESEDAGFLRPKFTEFKQWRDAAAKTRETKGKRLEAAVDPKGQPRTATPSQSIPNEDAAFEAGFKSARGIAA